MAGARQMIWPRGVLVPDKHRPFIPAVLRRLLPARNRDLLMLEG